MNQSFYRKECFTWQAAAAGGARQRAPKRKLKLRASDVSPALVCKRLQLFWPEDGHWWPGTVTALRLRERRATLLYDTGACLGQCHFTWCLLFVLTRSDLPAAWPSIVQACPVTEMRLHQGSVRTGQIQPKDACTLCFSTQGKRGMTRCTTTRQLTGGACR